MRYSTIHLALALISLASFGQVVSGGSTTATTRTTTITIEVFTKINKLDVNHTNKEHTLIISDTTYICSLTPSSTSTSTSRVRMFIIDHTSYICSPTSTSNPTSTSILAGSITVTNTVTERHVTTFLVDRPVIISHENPTVTLTSTSTITECATPEPSTTDNLKNITVQLPAEVASYLQRHLEFSELKSLGWFLVGLYTLIWWTPRIVIGLAIAMVGMLVLWTSWIGRQAWQARQVVLR